VSVSVCGEGGVVVFRCCWDVHLVKAGGRVGALANCTDTVFLLASF
jgi:hypothetical protein